MSSESKMSPSSRPLSLILIAAVTKNNGLGTKGTLPWKLPKEMAHFRNATSATGSSSNNAASKETPTLMNAVIMGRKTWESIPSKFRPLKGRINVIISRSTGKEAETSLSVNESEHAYLVSSLDSAVELLQKTRNLARTFLIGGAQLYLQAMQETPKNAILDRLLITRIFDPSFDECDVFLPEFRSELQIKEDQESSHGKNQAQSNTEWKYCEVGELGSFIGEEVEEGAVEEKGVRYQLQMWQRNF